MVDPLTAFTIVLFTGMAGVLLSAVCWQIGYERGSHDEFMRAHKTKRKAWRADGK